jgi:alkylation response protein AidB-like acyl-CoA dehydrogenase
MVPDRPVQTLTSFPDPTVIESLMSVPLPAAGRTVQRFIALAEISAVDLSTGRLVEGHLDAVAILAEADLPPPDGGLGVWAADPAALAAVKCLGGWRLTGTKRWCSGAAFLSHALVTATTEDGPRLFLVDAQHEGIVPDADSWPAVGMAGSNTLDVRFDVVVETASAVGEPGWYTERAGFWFGSVGVAACWVGGAVGVVRSAAKQLRATTPPDPHRLASLGAAAARCEALAARVEQAAHWIDHHPADPDRRARVIALGVRQAAEEGCLSVGIDAARAGGAHGSTHDPAQARRLADLPVYVRQHHGGSDAAEFGHALLESALSVQ